MHTPLLFIPLILLQSVQVGMTYHRLVDVETRPLAYQDSVDIEQVFTEIVSQLSIAPGKETTTMSVSAFGQALQIHRIKSGMTASSISQKAKITLTAVEGIERGSVLSRGASYKDYQRYTEVLGIQLSHLIRSNSHNQNDPSSVAHVERVKSYQIAAEEAITQLKSEGKTISQRAISMISGISRQTLRKYPELSDLIEAVKSRA